MVNQKKIIEKTLSWRIIASLTTFTIAWAVTGKLEFGLLIGGIEFVAKIILYYLHENAWEYFKS